MSDAINWDGIPESLAIRQQWLLWRFEPNPSKPEKPRKVQYWVSGGKRWGTQGRDEDRSRLATLDVARRCYEKGEWSGVGFAFLPGDGLIGIDIDGAINDDGEVRPRDLVIVDQCASYAEYSPSGRGLHIIVEGESPINKSDDIGLEVYCGALWFTVTGKRWPGASGTVAPIRPEVLANLHKAIDEAKAAAQSAKELEAGLASRAKPRPKRAQSVDGGSRVDDFKVVNEAAMSNLDAWVPGLFPGAKRRGSKYRITSKQLGRDLEEDLSIDERGIKDFGVHDMGDNRGGARTPIDLVMEWLPAPAAKDALAWLAGRLGIALSPPPPRGPDRVSAGSSGDRGRRPAQQGQEAPPPGGGGQQPPDPPGGGEPPPDERDEAPEWDLIRARGKPVDCRENVLYCLTNDPELKGLVAQNTFTELHERTRRAPWGRDAGEWDEEDDLMLGEHLARTYGLLCRATTTIRAGVQMAARIQRYNPVHDLIRSQPWDRTERLASWLVDVYGVKDRPYVRLIGRLFIMGMVQRALRPGCKFDYMLILKGEEGLAKSTSFRVLAEPWFTDNAIRMGDKDSLMTMQLVWIAESAELESMNKSETTQIKQFLSANEDMFRPPYGARMVKRPRHAVNTGTTNADTFLKSATGDRRMWPLEVPRVDLDKLREIRQQLFAEALVLIEAGERYHPSRDEERELIYPEHEQFKVSDVWEDILAKYVSRSINVPGEGGEDPPARRAWFSTSELFERALAIKADRIDSNKIMEGRLANCMKALGFTRYRLPTGVFRPRGYLRPGCTYGQPVPLDLLPGGPQPPGEGGSSTIRRVSSEAPGLSREPGEDDDVPV